MPAPSIEKLFDFEGSFETAAQTILVASGIAAFIDMQTLKLPPRNTGVLFDVGAATDDLTQIRKPVAWPAETPPPMEFTIYDGTLELAVEVERDDNAPNIASVATFMAEVRGKIRNTFMQTCFPFDGVNLPYYRVSRIKPMGTSTGYDRALNRDFCRLRFGVRWAILPDAWPIW